MQYPPHQQPPQGWQQPQQPYYPQQPPPPPQKKSPSNDRFNRWLKQQSKLTQVGIGCGIPILALFLCVGMCSGLYALGANAPHTNQSAAAVTPQSTIVTHVANTPTNPPTSIPTSKPTPKATATKPPTPIAVTQVTPTPKPQPTTAPPPPKPTPTQPVGVNGNPWGYDFNPGNYIYSPPSAFCSYFACINNFWNGHGFVNECQDGSYSLSGGIRGDCSYHGGEMRPLYSH